MTVWSLIQNQQGELRLIEEGETPPEGWHIVAITANLEYIEQTTPTPEQIREAAKTARQAAVDRIRVTTSTGKVFDGDETSQTRMSRAIVAMQAAQVAQTTWVLADNTPTTVTIQELVEALILSGQAQSAMWVIE